MPHYLLELALWMLLAFFVGCIFGYLLRKAFGEAETETQETVEQTKPAHKAAPMAPKAATAAAPVMSAGKMERPKGISKAREGKADRLQKISGVGPKNEKVLHNLGFFHFDQIAAWTPEEIDWVDDHLKFNGRIRREKWTRQCSLLAEGKEEEFKKLFSTGAMKGKASQSRPQKNS